MKSARPSSTKRSTTFSGSSAQRLTPLYETSELDYSVPRDTDKKEDAVLIDADLAFKNTMTSDLKQVSQLSLSAEKVSYLNYGNSVLCKLPHLIRLDLSFNKIEKIQNLEPLKML